MDKIRLMVFGGCHVVGYAINPSRAFPILLKDLLDGELIAQIPHLKFVRLPRHLAAIEQAQPSHVVFQLGNYEFSASLREVMRQFKQAFGSQSPLKSSGTGSSSSSSSVTRSIDDADLEPSEPSASSFVAKLKYCFRVLGLGLITAFMWSVSAQHRRAFRELNAYMRSHPQTQFTFLSPFPCLAPAHNMLRDFGGWLLKRRLAFLPNCHWVNSQQLLLPTAQFFVDQLHLNEHGHCTLANRLANDITGVSLNKRDNILEMTPLKGRSIGLRYVSFRSSFQAASLSSNSSAYLSK
jgi:hypothetical protein